MAIAPCSICGKRFLGPAISGYHSWYTDQIRVAYRQRICDSCARERMATYVAWSVNSADADAHFPETCPSCGQALGELLEVTYSTWYRAKNRRDLVLATCEGCAFKIRSVYEQGGERLENREPVTTGVGEEGAGVRSNGKPPTDLPW